MLLLLLAGPSMLVAWDLHSHQRLDWKNYHDCIILQQLLFMYENLLLSACNMSTGAENDDTLKMSILRMHTVAFGYITIAFADACHAQSSLMNCCKEAYTHII